MRENKRVSHFSPAWGFAFPAWGFAFPFSSPESVAWEPVSSAGGAVSSEGEPASLGFPPSRAVAHNAARDDVGD